MPSIKEILNLSKTAKENNHFKREVHLILANADRRR